MLAGWEAELVAAESGMQPLVRSEATMKKAVHSLADARRRRQSRVDAMRRGLSVRKAGLDAASALKELAAVERIGSGLSEQPDLEEGGRIVTLVDRDLLEADALRSVKFDEAPPSRMRRRPISCDRTSAASARHGTPRALRWSAGSPTGFRSSRRAG